MLTEIGRRDFARASWGAIEREVIAQIAEKTNTEFKDLRLVFAPIAMIGIEIEVESSFLSASLAMRFDHF